MKTYFVTAVSLFICAVSSLFAQQNKLSYHSEMLQIEQISPNTFVHISYLKTQDFGKVGCNGMVVIHGGEALVFDTPANDEASAELIDWLVNEQKLTVKAVVASHFHDDCLGGLGAFHAKGIPSYGSSRTLALAKDAGELVPQNQFEESLVLNAGGMQVQSGFFGEGHTQDNVVAFVPADQVLFGGCLIKEVGAGFGFLGDANTAAWSQTVSKVKSNFPKVQTVIPGHGKIGGVELLDYTIQIFEGK
ncbi:subclass B1 metallo-beta-lactamase [Algoriphagus litoralis]|uniref:subclass B1 metallo-beta-lactamase n=1 Tax=Algoriphagus litoralis TaxID=2202829 RepID=UPI000DB99288|nr:subclass B1 metallo-beta-lactamase [Algoriphagus litoralis]